MYCDKNFRTKKALKTAVANGETVTYYQPGMFGVSAGAYTFTQPPAAPRDGVIYLEGPHYPEPHRWYAQAVVKDGKIVSVK